MEELKQKPNLKILVNELTQLLQEEEQRRQEFYNSIPESDKAEFINGEVIMHSPVKLEHGETSILLSSYIKYYCIKKKLIAFFYFSSCLCNFIYLFIFFVLTKVKPSLR